jgi:SAM-dependent methyltransferase
VEELSRQYDAIADAYGDGGPYNMLYERPAMLALLGDVLGLTVLDAGCGSGVSAEALTERGAQVTAADSSDRMLERARARLGQRASVRLHDLRQPLGWAADASFDVIVSSLAMHYIEDWTPVLAEFYRTLRDAGRFVFSTHHPFADYVGFDRPNYFAVEPIGDTWSTSGARYDVTFWRRPLGRIVADVIGVGFVVEQILEPVPASTDGLSEGDIDRLCSEPTFLFVAARKGNHPDA